MTVRCLALVAAASCLLAPGANGEVGLPRPTGPHAVGTMTLHVADGGREETLTADPGDRRELMVELWYPAAETSGLTPEWLIDRDRDILEATFGAKATIPVGIPAEKLERELRPLATHSFRGARWLDATGLPVLVFSHGFGATRLFYRFLTEELASHGYVVAAIDHTYCAAVTRFPDGRLAAFAPGFDARDRSLTMEQRDALLDQLVGLWAQDASAVLDELRRRNLTPGDPLAGRLALERAGILGHSFGGATAGETMSRDRRFAAGIKLDGMPYGTHPQHPLGRPFLFLRAPREPPDPLMLTAAGITAADYERIFDRFDQAVAAVRAGSEPGYLFVLRGAKHLTFSDLPQIAELSAIRKLLVGEQLAPARGAEIVRRITLAFFERHLLGKPAALLDPANGPPFPELEVSRGE